MPGAPQHALQQGDGLLAAVGQAQDPRTGQRRPAGELGVLAGCRPTSQLDGPRGIASREEQGGREHRELVPAGFGVALGDVGPVRPLDRAGDRPPPVQADDEQHRLGRGAQVRWSWQDLRLVVHGVAVVELLQRRPEDRGRVPGAPGRQRGHRELHGDLHPTGRVHRRRVRDAQVLDRAGRVGHGERGGQARPQGDVGRPRVHHRGEIPREVGERGPVGRAVGGLLEHGQHPARGGVGQLQQQLRDALGRRARVVQHACGAPPEPSQLVVGDPVQDGCTQVVVAEVRAVGGEHSGPGEGTHGAGGRAGADPRDGGERPDGGRPRDRERRREASDARTSETQVPVDRLVCPAAGAPRRLRHRRRGERCRGPGPLRGAQGQRLGRRGTQGPEPFGEDPVDVGARREDESDREAVHPAQEEPQEGQRPGIAALDVVDDQQEGAARDEVRGEPVEGAQPAVELVRCRGRSEVVEDRRDLVGVTRGRTQ
nr:hypothetical protein [Pseudonocardia sp. ICBG601]